MKTAEEYRRAVKAKCKECSGSLSQAKACRLSACPLWAVCGWHEEAPKPVKRTQGVQLTIKIKTY